jgi:response regulator of citrate/malate metabolism
VGSDEGQKPRTPAQAATATNSSERDARYFLQMLANDKLLKIDTETGKFKRP